MHEPGAYGSILAWCETRPTRSTGSAAAYLVSDEDEKAEALLEQVIERFPDYVLPRSNLARIYLRRGQLEAARALLPPLNQIEMLSTSDLDSYMLTMAQILKSEGNIAGATKWLRTRERFHANATPEMQIQLKYIELSKKPKKA